MTTRERILRAAAELFRKRGFNGTSMQDISSSVGITKSSLYHHFPSKQALLSEILELTVDRVTPAVQAVASSSLPAADRLHRVVETHVVELIRDRDNLACFIEEGRYLAPAYMKAYVAKRDRYELFFRQILEDGIETGEFGGHDVRLSVMAIFGMCNWIGRWYRADGDLGPEEIAEEFADLAVRAVASNGTRALPLEEMEHGRHA